MIKRILAKTCAVLAGMIFVIIPAVSQAAFAPTASGRPPIEQHLLREGTVSVKLAAVLNLGTTDNETQAETWLGENGLAPKNGWIAD
ncbi:MAG: hypothetical protein ABSA18_18000 [Dehalococcoidia bacterium]|jgi:hypothetical protein